MTQFPAPARAADSPAGPPAGRASGDPAGPAPRRRGRLLLAAVVLGLVALVAVAAGAVYLTDGSDPAGPDGAAGARGKATEGGATQPGTPGSPAASAAVSSPTAAGASPTVRYSFDGGLTGSVADDARRLPLAVSAAAGGQVTTERRDGGLAVRFPATCPVYGDKSCPRAILESGPAGLLNPGAGPFRYGAAVRLTAAETAKGENVLQKGYSQGDSQFKLQIDGAGGRPSCVLVGSGAPEIHVLSGTTSVADGQWHVIECARTGSTLTLSVDGAPAGQRNIPAGLSIVNTEPLRIGGKGTGPNNDQFHGAIDDVQVVIGA